MAAAAEIGPAAALQTNAQCSPINILPPELLAEIFGHCTCPVVLSHVSAHWRRTATTTPGIWGKISVTLPSPAPDIALAKVRTWLARSGAFPLHISLTVTEWSSEWPNEPSSFGILTRLRAHGGHWRRLSVTAGSPRIARGVFTFFTAPHLMLSRIDIKAGPFATDDVFLDDELEADGTLDPRADITKAFGALHVLASCAPRFTELNVLASVLPYASWRIAGPPGPELPHLRTLRVFEHAGPTGPISARSVLRLLAMCPVLESFSFRGWYVFDPRSQLSDIVVLPHLRELHLAQTFHQRIILSHLSVPNLETLRLSWLNRPDDLIDEHPPHPPPGAEDDADEDADAPVEYSQSPHTDVLTGLGLRALVRRCAPPLRVLDMDFADARSPRDFVWLFAHLPALAAFRIVGSDMSDAVLAALAAPAPDGAWRCPALRRVALVRCDMITGRGVVALARARNPPPGDARVGGPARLERLRVEVCAGVDCESVAVAQHLVGDVVFDVAPMAAYPVYPEECIQIPD